MMQLRFLGLRRKGKNSFYAKFIVFIFASSTISASDMSAITDEFQGLNPAQLRAKAIKYKKALTIDVAEVQKTLLDRVQEAFNKGTFDSPVKKINSSKKRPGTPGHANLRRKINAINIVVDPCGADSITIFESTRSAILVEILSVFKSYIEQQETDKENLALTVRNGSSPLRVIEIDTKSVLRAIDQALRGILDPNLAAFLKDCQLDVVLPAIHQPAAPVLDLKKEGARYVQKINTAIKNEGDLYDLVQQYRYDNSAEKHAMLIMMLGLNIESAATDFQPSAAATTMIEVGEELRDNFYETALLTFIHYISGNTNKKEVREIIALTNGGRGQSISEQNLCLLNQELTQIFYPRRESGSFTVTRYEFGRPSGNTSRTRQPLAIANFPVINAVVSTSRDVLGVLFANCMPSSHSLLTNGDEHLSSAIQDGKTEEI